MLRFIQESTTEKIEDWNCDLWVVMMGIEHERIHFETSAVIIRQAPLAMISTVDDFPDCPLRQTDTEKVP